VITDAYTKLERQERCCPECHSINLKLLNEKKDSRNKIKNIDERPYSSPTTPRPLVKKRRRLSAFFRTFISS
jgi:hypothetical protein